MSKHLMIDLETVDVKPTAAFQQIGWCLFELESTKIFGSGIIIVDVEDCFRHGLTADWKTIQWWMQQRDKARLNLLEPGIAVTAALFALRAVVGNTPEDWAQIAGVWSHGASFDIPILFNAWHKALFTDPPWTRKQVRDTRTIFMLSPAPEWQDEEDEKHMAEKDAISQAKQLQIAFGRMCSAFSPGFLPAAFH